MRRCLSFVTLLFGLTGAPAHAFTIDCARLLASFSTPKSALEKFEARAAKLLDATEGSAKLDALRAHYHRLVLRQTSRLLTHHGLDCAVIARAIRRHHLNLTAPEAAIRLVDRACAKDGEVLASLTAHAFETFSEARAELDDAIRLAWPASRSPERRHLRAWLEYVLGQNRLSRAQWLGITNGRGRPILPISELVKGDLGRLGFTDADVERTAEGLLRQGLPFDAVIARTRLPAARGAALEPSLDALQRLSYRARLNRSLRADDVSRFEARLAMQPPYRREDADGAHLAATRMMQNLVYDPAISFPMVQRIDRALEAHAARVYGAPIRLTFDPAGLGPAQIAHAHKFFGRAVVERREVLAEKRRFASYVEIKLRHAKFTTVDQFIAAFKIRNVYQASRRPPKTSAHVPEATLEEEAVARVYFQVLRDRLDEVLDLGPDARQMRFILETPLQFRHHPVDGPREGAWAKLAGRFLPNTFENFRKIHARVLRHAKSRLFDLPSWLEVACYQARAEADYARLKASGVDELLPVALWLGHAVAETNMTWLDVVKYDLHLDTANVAPRDAPLVNQLILLRQMAASPRRGDRTLERAAIEILGLSTSLKIPERRRADPRKTSLEQNLIKMYELFGANELPGDPTAVDETIRKMRAGLLNFLVIRSSNDRSIVVDRESYERLLPIAAENDFDVIALREGDKRVEIVLFGNTFYF